MSGHIYIGNPNDVIVHVDQYIKLNNFDAFEITRLSEPTKIEHARAIRRELSFLTNTKKLFILTGEITIEAQNALLKTIEELRPEIHFIFCIEHEDALLPTIHSRCNVVNIISKNSKDDEFVKVLTKIVINHSQSYLHEDLEGALKSENFSKFLSCLRKLLLDPTTSHDQKKLYYIYCKKTLKLAPLANINNVSEKIVLESIFE